MPSNIDPHVLFIHFNCEIQKVRPDGMISGIPKKSVPTILTIKCENEEEALEKAAILVSKIKEILK